jgi:hypothetical protein
MFEVGELDREKFSTTVTVLEGVKDNTAVVVLNGVGGNTTVDVLDGVEGMRPTVDLTLNRSTT